MNFLGHHFILVDLAQEQNCRHVSPFLFLSQSILTIHLLLLSLDTMQKRCFELGNSYRFIPAIFGNKLNLQGKLVHTSFVGYPWISPLIPLVVCKTRMVWAVWRPVFGPQKMPNMRISNTKMVAPQLQFHQQNWIKRYIVCICMHACI